MTAWGKTGRVDVEDFEDMRDARSGECANVGVDGSYCGWIGAPDDSSRWWARCGDAGWDEDQDIPTLDAAVMWVLQHAVGPDRDRTKAIRDVWRAERPIVWRVIPMWPISAFPRGRYGEIDTRPQRAATRWGAAPDGRIGDFATRDTWADAMHEALERSRAAHARQVNR